MVVMVIEVVSAPAEIMMSTGATPRAAARASWRLEPLYGPREMSAVPETSASSSDHVPSPVPAAPAAAADASSATSRLVVDVLTSGGGFERQHNRLVAGGTGGCARERYTVRVLLSVAGDGCMRVA